MTDTPRNVLFLCTGNSARSILAEAILNRDGAGRFRAYSAGSAPKGTVHPYAIDLLQRLNFVTDGLRSKSWSELADPGAPVMDFVFTVCDQAAAESCPIWPGPPLRLRRRVPHAQRADLAVPGAADGLAGPAQPAAPARPDRQGGRIRDRLTPCCPKDLP